ncbi:MAG: YebC/PmpR family DNA-binding transcriptional regulator [Pseudomonadales bacterium]|jgi:YebC/PmpR family DNA-binding regulatory protein|nr:YebC/PmpR family DNA-binding transcriptional regulator [Pseudomonadales bacterium]MDP6470986.1 YebC/PmpR family DNA-binding transcriptional regulator [Pseudomonadales bacterium]MDP6825829.1 YebC/PmpR family DNA-binding transcriptional regulator [Pseudomonadales bacterium]MDP6970178.1 YebC/PmpR family DNA-binding transcriptional regulator [Pseudomonadales bacterium]|tara:strand:+ start:583 stop:1323 length:741 start_codon:yes stop_codon:yes gene_type:complete
MAGHSKWANIKHKKARNDAKRGKMWTKVIREVTVAARLGGGDPDDNPRLRAAVDKALAVNMPKDTIERAISRGAGGLEGGDVEELVYEGYASGGVALLVEAMTDNRNRTAAEVRHAFNKHGGNLGTDGSVAYLFSRQGVVTFAPGADEEVVMEAALEAGAEDIENENGALSVITPWEALSQVVDALKGAGLKPEHADVAMVASTTSELDAQGAEKVLKLVDALEDLDDVQNVYSNAELPDDLVEEE